MRKLREGPKSPAELCDIPLKDIYSCTSKLRAQGLVDVGEKLLERKCQRGQHKNTPLYSLSAKGAEVLKYLEGKAQPITIPIFQITNDYLRGFFDGEGHISAHEYGSSYRINWEITNTCLPLMNSIFNYLQENGYHPKIRYCEPRKSTYKPYVRILMSGFEDIERWFLNIGSCHPLKLSEWEKMQRFKLLPKKIAYPRTRIWK